MRKFVITIDGKQYEACVEEVAADGSVVAPVAPVVTEVKAAAPAPKAAAAPKASAPVNGTKMEAPMPGMIKALKLEEGATVKKGDVILVLEAMKMDNDITAPCDGTISYKVTKGSNVDTGALMAVIG